MFVSQQIGAMSRPVPLFRATNWPSYSRSLKRRGSLMGWFDHEMDWFAAPSGKAGHAERFSAAAIQFYLSIKLLFGFTPGLQLVGRIRKAHEPALVQAFRPAPTIERLDEGIVGRLSRA